jgi:hypothetical protein
MAANTINQLSTANTFQHWLNATELLIATANLLTNGNGEAFYANTRLIIGGSGANVSLNVETSATINTQTSNTVNTVNATVRNLVVTANVENVNVTNDLFVGDDLTVYGQSTLVGDTIISGNLTVSGNLTLDEIGFDDLKVNGSATISNTLGVTGATTLSNVTITGNIATLNVTSTANIGGSVYIGGDLTIGGNTIIDSVGFNDLTVSGNAIITGTSNTTGNATFRHAEVTGTLTANNMAGVANTRIFTAIEERDGSALAYAIALG